MVNDPLARFSLMVGTLISKLESGGLAGPAPAPAVPAAVTAGDPARRADR